MVKGLSMSVSVHKHKGIACTVLLEYFASEKPLRMSQISRKVDPILLAEPRIFCPPKITRYTASWMFCKGRDRQVSSHHQWAVCARSSATDDQIPMLLYTLLLQCKIQHRISNCEQQYGYCSTNHHHHYQLYHRRDSKHYPRATLIYSYLCLWTDSCHDIYRYVVCSMSDNLLSFF